jgi:para-nitrobenzyl esterase
MSESRSSSSAMLNRRQALLISAAAGAAALTRTASASDSTKTAAHQEPGDCTTPASAVANTQYGKVRGYLDGGALTFKGVPYGADTGGANRWLPAQPPKAWTDVRPTLVYGANCPQTPHPWHRIEASFLLDWDDGYMDEDMLKLNVWTPSLTGKRPVMVYLHGGGFSFGSAYELPSHEGAQLARHHDVVQVSVNHRLNALGFLDLSEIGGPSYADSANVGMTDLVASLKWVRDNIANFGGDPGNVMIYGQSGGGSKVTCLMGMPSAAGLFHRAAVQSGGGGNFADSEQSRALSRQLMVELGLQPNDIAGLQKTEWTKLYAAGQAAVAKVNGPATGPAGTGIPPAPKPRVGWAPTMDGRVVPVRAFYDTAPEVSKNIPLLIGCVSEEGVPNALEFDANPTEAEWRASLTKIYGAGKANRLADAMKKAHPEKTIAKLAFGVNGLGQRNNVQRMVKLKYEQKGSPVYQYWFTWQTKQLDGRPGAWHTSELAFCFDNTKRGEQATGNTPEAQSLAKKMSTAWVNFARTGNPSQPGLEWAPTDAMRCQTMIFDNETRMVDDPDGAVRKILLG